MRLLLFSFFFLSTLVLAEEPFCNVFVKNPQDQASVCFKPELLEVTVTSQRGIGALRLTRKEGQAWPKRLQLRIDVHELEGFSLRMGTETLDVSRKRPGPLTIALRGTSVQIDIPRSSLPEASARFIDIQWIDFYR